MERGGRGESVFRLKSKEVAVHDRSDPTPTLLHDDVVADREGLGRLRVVDQLHER
jgi:hypothetical protein